MFSYGRCWLCSTWGTGTFSVCLISWFFHFINVYITYEINKVDRPKSEEVELFFRLVDSSEFEFLIHVDINLLRVFLILTDHSVNSS